MENNLIFAYLVCLKRGEFTGSFTKILFVPYDLFFINFTFLSTFVRHITEYEITVTGNLSLITFCRLDDNALQYLKIKLLHKKATIRFWPIKKSNEKDYIFGFGVCLQYLVINFVANFCCNPQRVFLFFM